MCSQIGQLAPQTMAADEDKKSLLLLRSRILATLDVIEECAKEPGVADRKSKRVRTEYNSDDKYNIPTELLRMFKEKEEDSEALEALKEMCKDPTHIEMVSAVGTLCTCLSTTYRFY